MLELDHELMEIQADIQVALGIHRVNMQPDLCSIDVDGLLCENRLARALARVHRLLAEQDVHMARAAQHPDVPYIPQAEYESYPDRQDGMG